MLIESVLENAKSYLEKVKVRDAVIGIQRYKHFCACRYLVKGRRQGENFYKNHFSRRSTANQGIWYTENGAGTITMREY